MCSSDLRGLEALGCRSRPHVGAVQLLGLRSALPGPRLPAGLAFARSCYDHLAGRLGVALHDRLVELDAVRIAPDTTTLTEGGVAVLSDIGVTVVRERSRPLVRQCLDWSQRRHHLAGTVGARLLGTMIESRWLQRSTIRPRELRLSRAARDGLRAHLGIEV